MKYLSKYNKIKLNRICKWEEGIESIGGQSEVTLEEIEKIEAKFETEEGLTRKEMAQISKEVKNLIGKTRYEAYKTITNTGGKSVWEDPKILNSERTDLGAHEKMLKAVSRVVGSKLTEDEKASVIAAVTKAHTEVDLKDPLYLQKKIAIITQGLESAGIEDKGLLSRIRGLIIREGYAGTISQKSNELTFTEFDKASSKSVKTDVGKIYMEGRNVSIESWKANSGERILAIHGLTLDKVSIIRALGESDVTEAMNVVHAINKKMVLTRTIPSDKEIQEFKFEAQTESAKAAANHECVHLREQGWTEAMIANAERINRGYHTKAMREVGVKLWIDDLEQPNRTQEQKIFRSAVNDCRKIPLGGEIIKISALSNLFMQDRPKGLGCKNEIEARAAAIDLLESGYLGEINDPGLSGKEQDRILADQHPDYSTAKEQYQTSDEVLANQVRMVRGQTDGLKRDLNTISDVSKKQKIINILIDQNDDDSTKFFQILDLVRLEMGKDEIRGLFCCLHEKGYIRAPRLVLSVEQILGAYQAMVDSMQEIQNSCPDCKFYTHLTDPDTSPKILKEGVIIDELYEEEGFVTSTKMDNPRALFGAEHKGKDSIIVMALPDDGRSCAVGRTLHDGKIKTFAPTEYIFGYIDKATGELIRNPQFIRETQNYVIPGPSDSRHDLTKVLLKTKNQEYAEALIAGDIQKYDRAISISGKTYELSEKEEFLTVEIEGKQELYIRYPNQKIAKLSEFVAQLDKEEVESTAALIQKLNMKRPN